LIFQADDENACHRNCKKPFGRFKNLVEMAEVETGRQETGEGPAE
jgi:hypothetical protein